jgi:hypothetical protein
MCTGIFAGLSAKAAEEMLSEGKTEITPYWRALKEGGKLNEKFPGGAASQAERLIAEGFDIEPGKGKQPPKVKDYEKYLVEA